MYKVIDAFSEIITSAVSNSVLTCDTVGTQAVTNFSEATSEMVSLA